jgi:hypothetical protein
LGLFLALLSLGLLFLIIRFVLIEVRLLFISFVLFIIVQVIELLKFVAEVRLASLQGAAEVIAVRVFALHWRLFFVALLLSFIHVVFWWGNVRFLIFVFIILIINKGDLLIRPRLITVLSGRFIAG